MNPGEIIHTKTLSVLYDSDIASGSATMKPSQKGHLFQLMYMGTVPAEDIAANPVVLILKQIGWAPNGKAKIEEVLALLKSASLNQAIDILEEYLRDYDTRLDI